MNQQAYGSNDVMSGDDDLAGRGARLGAAIIDVIILLAIAVPLMYYGGYIAATTAAIEAGETGVGLGTTVLWTLIMFAVFAVVQWIPLNANGQTWGKKMLGIKIVDLAGNRPPIGRLLGLRYFPVQMASAVPIVGPLLGLVNVLLIFRADRRCGHDLIAGTRVIHAN